MDMIIPDLSDSTPKLKDWEAGPLCNDKSRTTFLHGVTAVVSDHGNEHKTTHFHETITNQWYGNRREQCAELSYLPPFNANRSNIETYSRDEKGYQSRRSNGEGRNRDDAGCRCMHARVMMINSHVAALYAESQWRREWTKAWRYR